MSREQGWLPLALFSAVSLRNRMKNRTFSNMAADVESALQELRDAEQNVRDREGDLMSAKAERSEAQGRLNDARDALFEAHPELRPVEAQVIVSPEVLWVDDPDDVPGGPLEFRESG